MLLEDNVFNMPLISSRLCVVDRVPPLIACMLWKWQGKLWADDDDDDGVNGDDGGIQETSLCSRIALSIISFQIINAHIAWAINLDITLEQNFTNIDKSVVDEC